MNNGLSDDEREEQPKLEKVSIVELRQNSKQILQHYEDDYKHDLSIHLYSTYLMHQMDSLFPHRSWACWPKPQDDVPDPKTTQLYTDEPETMSNTLLNRTSKILDKNSLQQSGSDQSNSISGSDPTETLKIEVERLFKRKIYHQIMKNPDHKYHVQPSIEHTQLPDMVMEKITDKIDDLMTGLSTTLLREPVGPVEHDWRVLLMQSKVNDQKFIKKVENIFIKSSKEALKETKDQDKDSDSNDSDDNDESDEETSEGSDESQEQEDDYPKAAKKRNALEEKRQAFKLRNDVIGLLYEDNKNKVRKISPHEQYEELEI